MYKTDDDYFRGFLDLTTVTVIVQEIVYDIITRHIYL